MYTIQMQWFTYDKYTLKEYFIRKFNVQMVFLTFIKIYVYIGLNNNFLKIFKLL